MRVTKIIVATIATFAASAVAAQPTEIDYPKGTLAIEAISNADYARAEAQLRQETRVASDDPALLLNLAHVLAKTGRLADAAKTYERVLVGEDVELELVDGRVMSSHEAAQRALLTVSVGGPLSNEK